MRTLFKFHGGVHPPTNKTQSNDKPIRQATLPSKLVIPLHQHVGNRAVPVVEIGQHVLKGQVIGRPEGRLSSAVHASTSGSIAAIDMQQVAHPSGLSDLCITLVPDGRDEWIVRETHDWRTMAHTDLRHLLREAGVVGLGGAVFPSDMKLYAHKHKITTLVLNGAECEPWITCDDRLMRERAADILQGAEIMRALLYADEVLIGVEDNKPEAVAALQAAVAAGRHEHIEIIAVPTLYPGGGAKQLIRVLTGIEVPHGVRSTDMGVQCFNVGTAYGAWRAVAHGEPLLSRIVTVTGHVAEPQNFEVPFGMPIDELVEQAGRLTGTTGHIMGGPMMGFRLPAASVGVIKATNCIIAMSDALFPPAPPAMPCIRCTRCAEACPADLQPQELHWFAKAKNFGKAQEYHLFDCIECGACSYVCPSHIPLVQYFQFAKSEIHAREQDRQAADRARERHEFREFRSEREKREKAERLAAKEKAAMAEKEKQQPALSLPPDTDPENTVQRKIQAAIDLAKEQAAAVKPQNTVALSAEQLAEIAEIEARRTRIRELAQSHVEPTKE